MRALASVALSRRQGAGIIECLALLTRAQVLNATDGGDAGAADLDAALALARQTGAVIYEVLISEQLGRLCGEESTLRDVVLRYRAMGATGRARGLESELQERRTRGSRNA